MIKFLVRHLISVMSAVCITACSSSYRMQGFDQDVTEIRTYQDFLDWSAEADIGAQIWLSNVTVRLWPGEYLVIFSGTGSSYERCLFVSLTDQQVREIRQGNWSANEDSLEALIEVSGQASGANVCSGSARTTVPSVTVRRIRTIR